MRTLDNSWVNRNQKMIISRHKFLTCKKKGTRACDFQNTKYKLKILSLLTVSPCQVCTRRELVLLSQYRLQLWKVFNAYPMTAHSSIYSSPGQALGRSNPGCLEQQGRDMRAVRYLQQKVVTSLELVQLYKTQGPRVFGGHKRKAAQLYSHLSISPHFKSSRRYDILPSR